MGWIARWLARLEHSNRIENTQLRLLEAWGQYEPQPPIGQRPVTPMDIPVDSQHLAANNYGNIHNHNNSRPYSVYDNGMFSFGSYRLDRSHEEGRVRALRKRRGRLSEWEEAWVRAWDMATIIEESDDPEYMWDQAVRDEWPEPRAGVSREGDGPASQSDDDHSPHEESSWGANRRAIARAYRERAAVRGDEFDPERVAWEAARSAGDEVDRGISS